jgi:hypothetical protein
MTFYSVPFRLGVVGLSYGESLMWMDEESGGLEKAGGEVERNGWVSRWEIGRRNVGIGV